MNERLKEVRRRANMTQAEFGASVGASRGMIAKFETGLVVPDSSIIELICIKFNVNREWLETGQGQPYKENALIPELVRVLRSYPALYATLERIMPAMTDAEWQALDAFLDRIRQGQL